MDFQNDLIIVINTNEYLQNKEKYNSFLTLNHGENSQWDIDFKY